MRLYQEIIFLQTFFKGNWIVENVISYYDPLIKPQSIDRHYFWSDFYIHPKKLNREFIIRSVSSNATIFGFNISKYKLKIDKRVLLRNLVNPKIALHIFNCAFKEQQKEVGEWVK